MNRDNTTTGLAVLLAVILLLAGYLIYRNGQNNKHTQSNSSSAPTLSVAKPADNSTSSKGTITVSGTTDRGDTVTVNDQPVNVTKSGSFETTVTLSGSQNYIFIKTRSTTGKETVLERKVVYSGAATSNSSTSSSSSSNSSSSTSSSSTASGTTSTTPTVTTPTTQLGTTGVGDDLGFLALAALGTGFYAYRRSQKQLDEALR